MDKLNYLEVTVCLKHLDGPDIDMRFPDILLVKDLLMSIFTIFELEITDDIDSFYFYVPTKELILFSEVQFSQTIIGTGDILELHVCN